MSGCGSGSCQGRDGNLAPYNYYGPPPGSNNYVVNSKIMVVAVAVLFAVVLFILCLHIYAKWFWRNQGAIVASDGTLRTLSWRRRRYTVTVNATPVTQAVGLERAVIEALPTFEFDGERAKRGFECAVCLEEFELGEKGRTLPKCDHSFHLDCIDMWLHSHSTCPLCRTSVGADETEKKTEAATVMQISEPPQMEAPVMGDVGAPFMAAMRASRRSQRSRGQLPALNSSPRGNSLPRTAEDQGGENHRRSGTSETAVAVDQQQNIKDYETPSGIPSNVLFWGNHAQMSSAGAGGSAEARAASSIRAPFQVTIDIPRSGPAAVSNSSNVLSPMARASASFRRLLSRGKSVVSPQTGEDGVDEGGPSSSPRPPPPHA